MTISTEQMKELEEAAKPLMLWIEKNCHPHCEVTVDSHSAELKEDISRVIRKD